MRKLHFNAVDLSGRRAFVDTAPLGNTVPEFPNADRAAENLAVATGFLPEGVPFHPMIPDAAMRDIPLYKTPVPLPPVPDVRVAADCLDEAGFAEVAEYLRDQVRMVEKRAESLAAAQQKVDAFAEQSLRGEYVRQATIRQELAREDRRWNRAMGLDRD